MFAVMGYQIRNEDFQKALICAYHHLKLGGLFIFDVWFGPAVLSQKPGDRIKIIENNGEKIIRLTKSTLNIMKHIVNVNFIVLKFQDNKMIENIEEIHQVRFFFPMELEVYFENVGFQILKTIPFMEMEGVLSKDNWDMTVVTRKIK